MFRPASTLLCVVSVATVVVACGTETFVDGANVPTDGGPEAALDGGALDDAASSDGAASTDGTSIDVPAAACPTGMVRVPAKSASPGYCIDNTEVTQTAYAQFLTAMNNGAYAKRPGECAAKTGHVPGGSADCSNNAFDPLVRGKYPVSCVDWCDAWSYCDWAGKQLCGKAGGGALGASAVDETEDAWWRACNGGDGDRKYPYGGSYSGAACGTGQAATSLHLAGALATCEGGVPGLFDMSGNVAEWTWLCDSLGGAYGCATRGGDYGDEADALACEFSGGLPLLTRMHQVGFRCCK